MYLAHFGLSELPFGITPNPAFFYAGGKRGDILDALLYAVTNGAGIVKVTGEVGSGKTMLCKMLEDRLPSNIEVICLVNPTIAREQVVYAIAAELGLPTHGLRPDEMIRCLQHALIARHANGKQVVLLVEEAQAMSMETLEEIRLFSNLETTRDKLLQIVLFGQPELNENLAVPRMRQLKERITQSFAMPPLAAENVPEYLKFRMRAAGYRGPDVFSKEAAGLISRVSEGVVRRISILADKALLAAFAADEHGVTKHHVLAAIEDSEFAGKLQRARLRRVAGIAVIAAGVAVAGFAAAWQPNKEAPVTVQAPLAAQATAVTVGNDTQTSPEKIPVALSIPATDALLQQRMQATGKWLDHAPDSNFTIQLILTEDNPAQAERVLRKIETQLGADQLYVYRTHIGGGNRLAVTWRSFDARGKAREEMAQLSSKYGYQPQLRTVGGLKSEIARAGGRSGLAPAAKQ